MTAYRPVVGDTVESRWTGSRPGDAWFGRATVKWVGDRVVVLDDERAYETVKDIASYEWRKVDVYPERWITVYADGYGASYETRALATLAMARSDKIGLLHVYPDGSTTMEAL